MTPLLLVRRFLQGRLLATTSTVLSIGLGVGLIVATALLSQGVKEGFVAGATDFNLIVGAKGSPTQLVLSTVFRMDVPTPNIGIDAYEELRRDPRVELAVPVGLGDAYQGFRYVATTDAYFAAFPWRRHGPELASGKLFRADTADEPGFEAVVGAEAMRRTGLRLGDRFYEGEEMAEYPLTVVGALRPSGTADDRAIFISLPSYWQMNELSRKAAMKPLTAVLARPKRLADLTSLHRAWNVSPIAQAAMPSAILLDVFNLIGLVEDVLLVVLAVVVALVASSLFVTMYDATLERRREIATMRALGARRGAVLRIVLLESCVVAALGGIVGIAGGHGIASLGASLLSLRGGPVTRAFALSALQPATLAAVIVLGALAGLLPALLAYRTEVAEHLAPL